MSSGSGLTTTSYSILGLLAVRSWTTHELVQQVDRSVRRFWPRAQSKLYEEPKKLVSHGLARAEDDPVGRRPRTRYTITAKGRRALAAWLSQPGDGPVLEFEQLLKVYLSDGGTRSNLLANLEATRVWVLAQHEQNLVAARTYAEGSGAFPERAAVNQLVGRFLTEWYATVARWTQWATDVVSQWPERIAEATVDPAMEQETLRLAESIPSLFRDPSE